MKRPTIAAALLAPALLAAPAVRAAEPSAQANPDRWRFTLSPYAMGATMEGDIVVKGRPAAVDLSASDIFDHMDFGFMGGATARKGNWGVAADLIWVELSATTDMPPAEVEPTLGIVTVQAIRRINDWADLTFGGRWNHLQGRVEFGAPIDMDFERSRDWADPVVGVLLRTPESHRWRGSLAADIGGFGLGSDFARTLFPSAGVRLSDHVTLDMGWRFIDTDYDDGAGAERFEYDMHLQGPVVGCTFSF